MTKAEESLGRAIASRHYVELKSKSQLEAASKLANRALVRIYDHNGSTWAKANSRAALEEMSTWR